MISKEKFDYLTVKREEQYLLQILLSHLIITAKEIESKNGAVTYKVNKGAAQRVNNLLYKFKFLYIEMGK